MIVIVAVICTMLKPLFGDNIAVDFGHGGRDTGTQWDGNTEASCTYRLGYELCEALEEAGAHVGKTVKSKKVAAATKNHGKLCQPTDAVYTVCGTPVHADVHGCSVRANGWGSKWTFLSLHVDEVDNSEATGGMVYCANPKHPCQFAKILASTISKEGIGRVGGGLCGSEPAFEDLWIFNNSCAEQIKEKALYEVCVPANSDDDEQLLLTKAGRRNVIRIIVKAFILLHQRRASH